MAAADAYSEDTLNLRNLHWSNIFVSTVTCNVTTSSLQELYIQQAQRSRRSPSEMAEKGLRVNSESTSHRRLYAIFEQRSGTMTGLRLQYTNQPTNMDANTLKLNLKVPA